MRLGLVWSPSTYIRPEISIDQSEDQRSRVGVSSTVHYGVKRRHATCGFDADCHELQQSRQKAEKSHDDPRRIERYLNQRMEHYQIHLTRISSFTRECLENNYIILFSFFPRAEVPQTMGKSIPTDDPEIAIQTRRRISDKKFRQEIPNSTQSN